VPPQDRPQKKSLRVFEIARISSRKALDSFVLDLPVTLAKRRSDIRVVFLDGDSELGWHAHVTDDDGEVLLSFPWTDHVDEILTKEGSSELPVEVPVEGWQDLDQGWWASVVLDGDDIYVAETDFDAIADVPEPDRIENPTPGVVLVNGVEVRWNVVSKRAWGEAWDAAREACRQGTPAPVGEWDDEPGSRIVIHA
jgi:hypothetical protein